MDVKPMTSPLILDDSEQGRESKGVIVGKAARA